MGFVTGKVSAQLQSHLAEPTLSIFIPTTPNPTSGWYAIVPESEAIDLEISIEDAFKVLISGGIVSPGTTPPSVPLGFSRSEKVATSASELETEKSDQVLS